MKHTARSSTRALAGFIAVALLVTGALFLAGPASAQQDRRPPNCNPNPPPGPPCDPPGCDQGPPDPYTGGNPNCSNRQRPDLNLSLDFGPPGSDLRVQASGFEPLSTVAITFGGQVVRTATAQPQGGATAAGTSRLAVLRPDRLLAAVGLIRAQSASNGAIDETIQVPDVRPGLYDVCVSSEETETACGTFRVTAKTSVAGVTFSRGGDGDDGVRVLGRTFARTGFGITLLLILGVGFLLVGRSLRAASRRRRVRA